MAKKLSDDIEIMSKEEVLENLDAEATPNVVAEGYIPTEDVEAEMEYRDTHPVEAEGDEPAEEEIVVGNDPLPEDYVPEDLGPVETIDETSNLESAMDELSEEDRKIMEALLSKTQFYSRKNLKAKQSIHREMFRSEHIVTASPDDKVETESTKLMEDFTMLNASAQSKRILEGKITGCHPANPDNPLSTTLAEVKFGNGTCKVLIPDYLLFDYEIGKYRNTPEQANVAVAVRDMIGLTVRFTVTQLDRATKTAYADRLQALDTDGYFNYVKPTKDGKPRITAGMIAQGRVVRRNKKTVTICALGAERTLRANADENEICWNYCDDFRDMFKVDQIVNVKILEVKTKEVTKYNNNYTLVKPKFSLKQTTVNPTDKYFDDFVENGHYTCVVTSLASTGVFVRLPDIDGMDCLVAYPKFGEMPMPGQARVIKITEKEIDANGRKKIFGTFVQ